MVVNAEYLLPLYLELLRDLLVCYAGILLLPDPLLFGLLLLNRPSLCRCFSLIRSSKAFGFYFLGALLSLACFTL
jgi:hypothetical protein